MKPIGIVAIIIATGVVVGGGVYMWQSGQNKTQQNTLNSQISTLQSQVSTLKNQTSSNTSKNNQTTPVTSTSTVNTGSWQTHTNTNWGYSLKVPSDWTSTTSQLTDTLTSPARTSLIKTSSPHGPVEFGLDKLGVTITTYDSLKEFVSSSNSSLLDYLHTSLYSDLKTTIVDGQTAYSVRGGGCEGECGLNYVLEHNQHIYYLTFTIKESETLDDTAKAILQSFEFTNLVSDVSDWQNFSSKYFTLSFKIPPGFVVNEDQDHIRVSKAPYDAGNDLAQGGGKLDNAFFGLARYSGNNTSYSKETNTHRGVDFFKNKSETSTKIDSASFLTMEGDVECGEAATNRQKARVVFFDRSFLTYSSCSFIHSLDTYYGSNDKSIFDRIDIGNKIISTMKFSK